MPLCQSSQAVDALGAGTLITWPQVHTILAPTSCELRGDRGLEMSSNAALHGIYAGSRLIARCGRGQPRPSPILGLSFAIDTGRYSRRRHSPRCHGGDRQDQKNTAGPTWLQLDT
jgi:hypothetical protein